MLLLSAVILPHLVYGKQQINNDFAIRQNYLLNLLHISFIFRTKLIILHIISF